MLELLSNPEAWVLLLTLASIEIVLGIDNIVFISIAVSHLEPVEREKARKFGILAACVTRILLLLSLAWLANQTHDLFTIMGRGFSMRDIVLILGGAFLIYKGIKEILELIAGEPDEADVHTKPKATFWTVIAQIAVIDIVFSLDSVIAAVGMASEYQVIMVLAILLAVAVMLLAAKPLGQLIDNNPTIKMLALSFIVLIGAYLLIDGLGIHFPKAYIYGSMGFSAAVEALNILARRRRKRALAST